ncbi:ornithine decarboxylase, putative [Entamoeba invadens IP1]|uniref:ornithine decarboxylase n=1 Tax=Entamoeba invadens IP1 TaxID=370355 RepID=A0A0A1UGX5_ENTIV|nr:ornithine decarboxylase, putative [Entamoeba invadens IP1]ELP95249.1 ornithine decarboxylase, putative [Entamoeba invadens IP1]|eukprot:XP_004262020.1 ornithine decarboxylase, putative [Entamoeba invadens IP1]
MAQHQVDLEALNKFALDITKKYTPETQPLAFWVFDIQSVENAITRWHKNLPTVKPCFAVKCNPEPHLVELVGKLGCGFDCATLNEVKEVLDLGFKAEDITFSQAYKPFGDLIAAYSLGVRLTLVDSVYEDMKNDSSAGYTLGDRFGLKDEREFVEVLDEIEKLGLDMKGVHFHVGSDFHNVEAFKGALTTARHVAALAEKRGMKPCTFDVGGGFSQTEPFEEFAQVIENAIKELNFPAGSKFIAEPGRYLASDAFHLITSVHGKRLRIEEGKKEFDYTIGDGIHGGLAHCFLFKKIDDCYCLQKYGKKCEEFDSLIYGPSCNGADKVGAGKMPEMEEGVDWVVFPCAGAYTISLATNFNGFQSREHDVYVMKNKDINKITLPEEIEKNSIPALMSHTAHWIKN